MSDSILLQNVIHQGKSCDILIRGNRFHSIAPNLNVSADRTLDCAGKKAILPPFYNTHTHAAMTLLRGYADDKTLFDWLNHFIWPAEAKLTPEDIYHGSRLAILEMIKTGTVFFSDMYWHQSETIRAVEEMGIRAAIGLLFIEESPGVIAERNIRANADVLARRSDYSDRIEITLAPHAIYTVSDKTLRQIEAQSRTESMRIHIHVSETAREVEDCFAAHRCSPIEYLERLGILTPQTLLAHAVHLSDDDILRIHDSGAVIAHMPTSNMKLASGQFRYQSVVEKGKCKLTLGTDGCASNNNLSMLSEMKFAALSAKNESNLPTVAHASDIFNAATLQGAFAYGIDAGIAEGKVADAMLIDLENSLMTPEYHLIANMVYSADSSSIDTVICNGNILMENRKVANEAEILSSARAVCRKIARSR